METSKKLSPQESMEIITNSLNKVKENFKYNSMYFIIWGWIVAIACILQYVILNYTTFKMDYLPWIVLVVLGWIITISYSVKKKNKKPYETYIDEFIKYLWIVLGISFLISVFFSFKLRIHPSIFVMLIGGIGTLITGLSLKFKPLIIGGLLFFIFAIASLYIPFSYILLVNATAMVFGYLIPAYLLKKA